MNSCSALEKEREGQESNQLLVGLQQKALHTLQQHIKDKQIDKIPCFVSEIPSIELWAFIRDEFLTTGTFTEKQADCCTMGFVNEKEQLDSTVLASMRDQMIKETQSLLIKAYSGEEYVFIHIPSRESERTLMLFELSTLVDKDLKLFSLLSKQARVPITISS